MEEKKLIERQLITTTLFIISTFISLMLTYNNYLGLNNNSFLNKKEEKTIGVTNRIFVLILALSYLYINIENKKINNSKYADLQIDASVLSVIASIIVLYVVLNSENYSVISEENPEI